MDGVEELGRRADHPLPEAFEVQMRAAAEQKEKIVAGFVIKIGGKGTFPRFSGRRRGGGTCGGSRGARRCWRRRRSAGRRARERGRRCRSWR